MILRRCGIEDDVDEHKRKQCLHEEGGPHLYFQRSLRAGEQDACEEGAERATHELSDDVPYEVGEAQGAAQVGTKGHRGVDVSTRHVPGREDQHHERKADGEWGKVARVIDGRDDREDKQKRGDALGDCIT